MEQRYHILQCYSALTLCNNFTDFAENQLTKFRAVTVCAALHNTVVEFTGPLLTLRGGGGLQPPPAPPVYAPACYASNATRFNK